MPGAIGYVSIGTAISLIEKGMPIKILGLNGVAATRENVLNGTYPIGRELNLVYRKDDKRIKNYLELFLSMEGQEIDCHFCFLIFWLDFLFSQLPVKADYRNNTVTEPDRQQYQRVQHGHPERHFNNG